MANLIGKALGTRVELVPVTTANRIPYLQTHKVDLVISSLGKNAEREKVIDFSAPYAPFFSAVYSAKGKNAGVKSLADLSGKTFGAARGTIEEQELTATAPKDATIKRFEDNNATIAAFMSGQVDLVATGNTIAAVIAERNPANAPELKFLVKNSPCYVGMNKNEPKLLAKVNEIIAQARASGEIAKLSEKWLKAPLPEGF
jgi:polar amino acid transport system substrate-binding protein